MGEIVDMMLKERKADVKRDMMGIPNTKKYGAVIKEYEEVPLYIVPLLEAVNGLIDEKNKSGVAINSNRVVTLDTLMQERKIDENGKEVLIIGGVNKAVIGDCEKLLRSEGVAYLRYVSFRSTTDTDRSILMSEVIRQNSNKSGLILACNVNSDLDLVIPYNYDKKIIAKEVFTMVNTSLRIKSTNYTTDRLIVMECRMKGINAIEEVVKTGEFGNLIDRSFVKMATGRYGYNKKIKMNEAERLSRQLTNMKRYKTKNINGKLFYSTGGVMDKIRSKDSLAIAMMVLKDLIMTPINIGKGILSCIKYIRDFKDKKVEEIEELI